MEVLLHNETESSLAYSLANATPVAVLSTAIPDFHMYCAPVGFDVSASNVESKQGIPTSTCS